MSEFFPEPKSSGGRVKVELDLSNHATKTDLKNVTGVDTSKCAKTVDLANLKSNLANSDVGKLKTFPTNLSNLKSKVDRLDADKIWPVPIDLSRLSDVVKNDVVKKNVYNAMIKNIEDKVPDIINLATNASLSAKISEVKGEIPSITNLATNASLNVEINEVKGEIPNISYLTTATALAAAENKIPSVSNLVKRTNYKIWPWAWYIIITQEINRLTSESFTVNLK